MNEFKETEIGLIPKDWDCVKVDDIKDSGKKAIISGPFGSNISSKFFVDSGVPVIRGNNLTIGKEKFIDEGFVFVSQEKADELNTWAIKDDIVLTAAGTLGQVGIIQENQKYKKYIISNKQIRLRVNKFKVVPLFLYYWLIIPYMTQFIVSRNTGSTIPLINLTVLKSLPLPLPDLKEQTQIVSFIVCLDNKIDNLRRQNETLEKIAQTLFKHWFIDFEFPNDDGKPYKSSGGAMVASELGDIPEGWRVGKLGEEFEILMGQSPSGSSFNEDKQGMIFFQGRTDFGFRFPSIRLYTTEPSRIAEKFDVLVSVRAPVGDVNLASHKCCIGRGLAAVKSQYKSYCLHKIKSFEKLFNVFESEGTVFGSINKQSFNSLESIIPTDKVIKDFEALVTTIDQKFYVNHLQIQTLTKTRDTLLPKLMSGQIRIKEGKSLIEEVK